MDKRIQGFRQRGFNAFGKKKYSFEFKINAVQSYLTTEMSYQEFAIQYGMNNPNLICKSEYLRELEDENLRLRIENAYLKELRRLQFSVILTRHSTLMVLKSTQSTRVLF